MYRTTTPFVAEGINTEVAEATMRDWRCQLVRRSAEEVDE
jgi:hypothetical protein